VTPGPGALLPNSPVATRLDRIIPKIDVEGHNHEREPELLPSPAPTGGDTRMSSH
jgi:hypothetical protein